MPAYQEGDPSPQLVSYWRRKFSRQDAALQAEEAEWESPEEVVDPDSPERAVMRLQTQEELESLIASLPSDKQEVVRMYYQGGLSSEDIAKMLDKLPIRVRGTLYTAYHRLEHHARKYGIESQDINLFHR